MYLAGELAVLRQLLFKLSSWILLKMMSWWFLGQVRNWVIWGKKLGHLAKSAEKRINTSGHIFEAIIMNLAQNVCLDDF